MISSNLRYHHWPAKIFSVREGVYNLAQNVPPASKIGCKYNIKETASAVSFMMSDCFSIAPKALIFDQRARLFNTTFNRQVSTMQSLYGPQLHLPKLTRTEMEPLLLYYPQRDRGIIADRVCETILRRQ